MRLDVLAGGACADQQQHDTTERGRVVAFRKVVEAGDTSDQQQVDDALVDAADEFAEQLSAKEMSLDAEREVLDTIALGASHAEHVHLFHQPDRLGDAAGEGHL